MSYSTTNMKGDCEYTKTHGCISQMVTMTDSKQCEFCSRPLKEKPVNKVLRGKTHTFCSEFCFRLFFYKIPGMKYSDLKNMYAARTVDLVPQDITQYLTKTK